MALRLRTALLSNSHTRLLWSCKNSTTGRSTPSNSVLPSELSIDGPRLASSAESAACNLDDGGVRSPLDPSEAQPRTLAGQALPQGGPLWHPQGLFPTHTWGPRGLSLGGPAQQQQRRGYVQLRTDLVVADNSGAKRVQCIKVLKGAKPNAAGLGDIIIASVKDALPRGKVKKGEVVTCVVVRSATETQRSDGSQIRFDDSAAVVITKTGEPIGTRVFGPVPHELRERKFVKILTLAQHVM